ncbi:prevent-host-death protein [Aerophototrophica crusticola]|uniref:Antitoxin n=1 Tax=Aerophototrophica crusticola TaxID=1709002 RepID=A0A858RBD7_9PROT|nr:prevent-host-death protein [Rhodospirillaceae bacterium B3]
MATYLDQVKGSRAPLVVTRQNDEPVVVLAEGEWASIQETLHLLSSPANARRLLASIAEFEAGGGIEHDLIDPEDGPGDNAPRLQQ